MKIEIGKRGEPLFELFFAKPGDTYKQAIPVIVWIDTGFNGSLQLSPDIIKKIDAPIITKSTTKVSGGTIRPVDIAEVDVFFNEKKIATCKTQVDEPALLGTDFLKALQFTFSVDYRNNRIYLTNDRKVQKKTLKAFNKYRR
jgi:clan AA aspartic protease